MPLVDLPFKPGIYADETPRDIGKLGYWKSGDHIRFFDNMPTKIGGWTRGADDNQYLGQARGALDWRSYRAEVFLAFGTNLKLYIWQGGVFYDITPIRASGSLTNPFSTTISSTTVTVDDASHGLSVGDYVHFSGASAVGGITVDGEYTVTTVVNGNQYTITHGSTASSTAGPGGGTVTFEYEIPVGVATSVPGLGWGAWTYGFETWGTPRSITDFLTKCRTWSVEQWGEDAIANYRLGGIYVWDSSAGVGTRATLISQAPSSAIAILVSPEDRHLIALGANDGSADNPMLVRWCDQENYTDWTPTVTNTAGSKQLDMGNELLCGAKVRGEHLLFTDSSLYSMTFVGPPDTFAFRTLGDNGGLAGPLAVHVFEGVAYWMGERDFFMYDGVTKVLECTIMTEVFDDFNVDQRQKVYAGINREFREVWWLFPSDGSDECDKYALFNIKDKTWAYGTLDRTMLIGDSDVLHFPYGFGTDNYIYTHESGTDAYDQALDAYIASGDVELDAGGNQLAHVSKLIPDFQELTGSIDVTIKTKKYPQATEEQNSGPHNITSTTEFINPRVRGRQLSVRWESSDLGDSWTLGTMRVDLIPHGGR